MKLKITETWRTNSSKIITNQSDKKHFWTNTQIIALFLVAGLTMGQKALSQDIPTLPIENPEIPSGNDNPSTESLDSLEHEQNRIIADMGSSEKLDTLFTIINNYSTSEEITQNTSKKYFDILSTIYDILNTKTDQGMYEEESKAYTIEDEINHVINLLYTDIQQATTPKEKTKIFDKYMIFLEEFIKKIKAGEKLNANDCKIYPNPLTHNQAFFVEFPDIYTTIQIFDILGKIVTTITVNNQPTAPLYLNGKRHVPINKLPSGVYFIKFIPNTANKKYAYTMQAQTITKKIVVN